MARHIPTFSSLISYQSIRTASRSCRRFARRSAFRAALLSSRWWVVLFLMVIPASWLVLVVTHRTQTDYVLLTGPKGGTYDKVGPRLAEVLNRPSRLEQILHMNIVPDFELRETCGSLENLFYIDHRVGQLAFAEDGLPLHFQRTSQCALPIPPATVSDTRQHSEIRLRALVPLYKSPLHILAKRSLGIEDVDDIPPHVRTYMGPEGSGTAFLARLVLDHYGIAVDRVGADLNYEEAARRVREGHIDVAFFLSGLGSGAVQALGREHGLRLLRVQHAKGLTMLYPFLVEVKILGAALHDDSQEISTIGTNTILVASSDLSELEVYEIAAKVDRNIQDILQDIPLNYAKLADMDPQKGLYYPLHDGAVRFYTNNPPFFMDPRTLAGIGTYLSLLFAFYTISTQFVRDYIVHRLLGAVDRALRAFRGAGGQPASKRYYHYAARLKQRTLGLLREEKITLDEYKRIDEYIKGHS